MQRWNVRDESGWASPIPVTVFAAFCPDGCNGGNPPDTGRTYCYFNSCLGVCLHFWSKHVFGSYVVDGHT